MALILSQVLYTFISYRRDPYSFYRILIEF